MKHRRIMVVVVVFLITTGFLLFLQFAQFSPFSRLDWRNQNVTPTSSADTNFANTLITKENALLGTKKWQNNLNKGFSVFIQAYTNTTSVAPNQKINFYISTLDQGTRYMISWYRLGWYNGDGARLMLATDFLTGSAQGYYDSAKHVLVNCHTCHVNQMTGLVDANWQSSYTLTIPSDWTTGVYLAKFTDEHRNTTAVPFDVQGNTHARYLVVTPDINYQAYNSWGGFSLFTANENDVRHSVQTSFNRPYMFSTDTNQLFDSELNAIRWLEMQGYDLSYISDVDLHAHPRLLMDHKALVFLGQDTFWTKEMRDGIEYARDHGVGMAFLGAATGTWQMRFKPDRNGKPNRTIISYRVTSEMRNLQFDPFYGKDNTRVTTRWRDALLARPENALIGVMYSDTAEHIANFNWHTNTHVPDTLIASTGLVGNKNYGCGLVGNVWDHVYDNGASPRGLVVLATSKALNDSDAADVSNTTYYIAPSGAMVFAAGSLYWSRGLDGYRFHQDLQCPATTAVPELQRLMENVMSGLVIHHKPPKVAPERPAGAPFVLNTTNSQSLQGRYLDTQHSSLPANQSAPQETSASQNNAHTSVVQTTSRSDSHAKTASTSHSATSITKKAPTTTSSTTHKAQPAATSSATRTTHTAQKPQQASLPDSHTSPGSFRGGRQGLRLSNDLVASQSHTVSQSHTTSQSHTAVQNHTTSQSHTVSQHTTAQSHTTSQHTTSQSHATPQSHATTQNHTTPQHTTMQSHTESQPQNHTTAQSPSTSSHSSASSSVVHKSVATQTALYQRILRETLERFSRSFRQPNGS